MTLNRRTRIKSLALTGMRLCIAAFTVAVTIAQAGESDDPSKQCAELLVKKDASLSMLVGAGCALSAEQISRLMDNPVGEMVSVPIQFDRIIVTEPFTGRQLQAKTSKIIPTFLIKVGRNWSLVNRIVIPYVDVPVNADAIAQSGISVRPDVPLFDTSLQTMDPFSGSTSGLGDLVYVGLFTPREAMRTKSGKVIWAVGPTAVFPTAEESILGQDQYQLGPAFALGYLGQKWTIGALAQHWWTVGSESDRGSVNQTNIQYFIYRKLPKQWSIGASPNITIDWSGSGSPIVNAPIGIGINKTLFLGKLPVRVGLEATRYVVHEAAIEPDWGLRLTFTPAIPSAFLGGGR